MEEFKNCFENYEISNFGNIRRKMKNGEYKNLKCSISNMGYKYIQIKRDGKRLNLLIHQLVAKDFLGDKDNNEYVIDHIDRNKLNNHVENLRYVSHKDNIRNSTSYYDFIDEEDLVKRRNLLQKLRYDDTKYLCECGKTYTNQHFKRHQQSGYHIKNISSMVIN